MELGCLSTSVHMERDTALLAYLLSRRSNAFSMAECGPQMDFYVNELDHVGSTHQMQLPCSAMADRRLSVSLFHNKRFSLDLGGPSDHFLSHSFHHKHYADRDTDLKGAIRNKFLDASQHSFMHGSTNRRMSNLGVLSASFFEEHAKTTRRGSIASAASFASDDSTPSAEKTESDDASMLSEIRSDDRHDDAVRLLTTGPIIECAFPSLVASEIKDIMEAFGESMVRSQKSQQAIHDWDKKMGLKRSHSKTMRLTMRSRKKLKVMIKKDVNALPL